MKTLHHCLDVRAGDLLLWLARVFEVEALRHQFILRHARVVHRLHDGLLRLLSSLHLFADGLPRGFRAEDISG